MSHQFNANNIPWSSSYDGRFVGGGILVACFDSGAHERRVSQVVYTQHTHKISEIIP